MSHCVKDQMNTSTGQHTSSTGFSDVVVQ